MSDPPMEFGEWRSLRSLGRGNGARIAYLERLTGE